MIFPRRSCRDNSCNPNRNLPKGNMFMQGNNGQNNNLGGNSRGRNPFGGFSQAFESGNTNKKMAMVVAGIAIICLTFGMYIAAAIFGVCAYVQWQREG